MSVCFVRKLCGQYKQDYWCIRGLVPTVYNAAISDVGIGLLWLARSDSWRSLKVKALVTFRSFTALVNLTVDTEISEDI